MTGEVRPLSPKSGDTLRVIALGRISTVHQDVENIAASYRYIESYLGRIYQGPLDITFLGEQASGMRTDRATIRQAEDTIATGGVDLVIAEDLSRIYRNPRHQYNFVQDAVDAGTRVILIGDNLDTADENWEVTMGAAALRHGLHIPDTRRRVRRTATHAFHQGGMVQKVRFGYRKLSREEAALGVFGPKGLRIAKVSDATAIIVDLSRRVIAGESYATLADVLNERGIAPGPYVTSGRWTSRVLAELLSDPILVGLRTFRDTLCEPVFRTGRHRTIKSDAPETARYPELAHLSETEFANLQAAIAARKRGRQKPGEHAAPRRGIARSRTFWPGQALRCGICGQLFHLAGSTLRCSQSSTRSGRRCWNRVQIRTTIARRRIVEWLLTVIEQTPDRRRYLTDKFLEFSRLLTSRMDAADSALLRKREALQKQAEHLTSAIAQGGRLAALVQRLQEVDAELKSLGTSTSRQRRRTRSASPAPETDLRPLIERLLEQSYPFADWLRRLTPEFTVHPAQAWDTPQIRAIGRFSFRWDQLTTFATERPSDSESTWVELPLFEESKPIRLLPEYLTLRSEHPDWSFRQIAQRLDTNVMTVKRASDYARLMQAAGTNRPYSILRQAPAAASRWRPTIQGEAQHPVAAGS